MNGRLLFETAINECGLTREQPVLVGVSGGPDSLCLVYGLAQLGFPVISAHFDHRLRPTSAAEAERVHTFAARLNVPFVSGHQDVAEYARQERRSLEEAARILRYRFLFAEARRAGAQAVAVGHTADDQVETFLMHLLRGAGTRGLSGMPFRAVLPEWDTQTPLVRPLLPFWRAETVAYCLEQGLDPIYDLSNEDPKFFRNRLRRELIPFLETYNPQIRQGLWRTARLMEAEEALHQWAVARAWEDCLAEKQAGAVALRLPAFRQLIPGLQHGVLRHALAQLNPTLRDVDFTAVERAVSWLNQPGEGQVDLVQGLRLFIEADCAWVVGPEPLSPAAEWPQLAAESLPLPVPGEVDLGNGWRLVSAWADAVGLPGSDLLSTSPWEAWLDAASLPGNLQVRSIIPGDRFQPLGMSGHSLKLADFWINQKLPRRARAHWPLVTVGESILWVPGYRLAFPYRLQAGTRQALHLRLFRSEG